MKSKSSSTIVLKAATGVLKDSAGLNGTIRVPGDKSITHRALLLGALANGRSIVRTQAVGRDNCATARALQQLGVPVFVKAPEHINVVLHEEHLDNVSLSVDEYAEFAIDGVGFRGFSQPSCHIDCGNSGTTARLLCGVLAAQSFETTLVGDESLSQRPFKRIVDPLSEMGAGFSGDRLPFSVRGAALSGLSYVSPRASAQVKSALLLAGLCSGNSVSVVEPYQSRDHTERMLSAMGVSLSEEAREGAWSVGILERPDALVPIDIHVPGDFSAAAFFMCSGAIFPNSELRIVDVGCSETRTGLYDILIRMGANISIENQRLVGGEKVGDIVVRSGALRGLGDDAVSDHEVVRAIDEIPILAVAAAAAEGVTCIRGAKELRVKESDRLFMMARCLESFGVQVRELSDGLIIEGKGVDALRGSFVQRPDLKAEWRNSGDHRIAMSGAVLELLCCGSATIDDIGVVDTSFPGFSQLFQLLIG